jgi:hypothetical protein
MVVFMGRGEVALMGRGIDCCPEELAQRRQLTSKIKKKHASIVNQSL